MSSLFASILIVGGVIASPVAVTLNLVAVSENVPRWIFIFGIPMTLLFLLALLAGVRLQYTIDSQYGRTYQALETLAGLREEGTVLWNEGPILDNASDVAGWIDKIRDWQSRVTVQIAVLSSVDARLFQTLRYWTAPDLQNPVNFYHSLNFRMLHRRLELIEEIIRRFSPK